VSASDFVLFPLYFCMTFGGKLLVSLFDRSIAVVVGLSVCTRISPPCSLPQDATHFLFGLFAFFGFSHPLPTQCRTHRGQASTSSSGRKVGSFTTPQLEPNLFSLHLLDRCNLQLRPLTSHSHSLAGLRLSRNHSSQHVKPRHVLANTQSQI